MASSSKGRKGKIGKKKGWIAAYYGSGRPWYNKAKRLAKHIRRYCRYRNITGAVDIAAIAALEECKVHMGRYHTKFKTSYPGF